MTGTTITSAGLVLAGTFIVLTFAAGSGSGGSQIRDIGLGLALGILMDTFLVRTLLVPSTVVLLGRWNWWPSKMSRVGAEAPAAAVPAQAAGSPGNHVASGAGGARGAQAARPPPVSGRRPASAAQQRQARAADDQRHPAGVRGRGVPG